MHNTIPIVSRVDAPTEGPPSGPPHPPRGASPRRAARRTPGGKNARAFSLRVIPPHIFLPP
jgi:hypothetical protein